MKEFTAKIIDPIGLHARPATLIVSTATKFKSDSKLIYNGREANLKSIMNIMALGIKHGAEITVKVLGEDEEAAVKAIEAALKNHGLI
ncbi:HPr family phosphocarrier protein [Mycoplasma sp. 2045]|uniref:HPr family phosphocarrier protein n=1 Tax=unclassified Mycoplasma TaxID=2683645 RepID=UPI00211CE9A6|nr:MULTISPECIES: HPr family phosphocarrier protein [unclassified Mycoplasma]MEA4134359.1 HPr family phosphocarrier protein [Mycoplasma sp. 2704]MEA4162412.1 HPr family phosphocarrier protein [Mycoplasma sp. 4404]MEA4191089.1 HPr family phosphocarrier protein [Mycoplasma sp. 2248]MEA4206000.1 HPr family phosphocarrier protein [Mycoplasma sp. 1199]MEA4276208.1 HPr family phosphocarrier protein [Mycoplasma sp. 21DD0573]